MGDPQIPVVDLEDVKSGDAARQAQAAEALRTGLGEFGLIYIRNHGVDTERLERFYDTFVELLARPQTEKETWARADVWYQRGWTPPNTEQAVVAGGQPDFKECYFVAPIALDERVKLMFPEIYAENSWPKDADEWREDYLALGGQVHEVGMTVLRACAAALDLPEDAFSTLTKGAPHVTRALRYLPLDEEQVGTDILWGEEHTDFNLLTLLPGGRFYDPSGARAERPDPTSGLYLRTRPTEAHPKGTMVHGKPPAGCIVAQVGQQLEILTGGTYQATPHVITPPKAVGWTRTALAHFIHVHSEEKLFPFERFVNEETIRAYGPPVLAGTYGLKTLVDIGLAPKDALEKLGYRHYDRLADARS
ncbi:MAG TPA: 2-oxoglutarate and iron-dependent oxygenase domain-containing protein [Polyangiaceae bacterium LLY-WYZ-15_(1-7)]|nr:oxidoreductase [Myxococcales bacterium]HJK92976.1 2-oxoglutarate and iron-dependent oxygenase domain-containing protein [Polyangiaceae bacterium LLY-WYZ-15_(1-7)]HJL05129.1 2-oxoglutarate and iron-dependent oxygenase domain-containing protein [Polyangiaceae bacterium LLY-WYZ-15_(1-7)]HJL10382.1 2-oxoglutarate and iron-dependent oxygenase domain-containing protein [Polyangiaceae bacterium LLY-WYZ-15_(1-7)]HJL27813.1 2-oxoglutarate and iron-dependent oxygenase domain-containing protein [Polyan